MYSENSSRTFAAKMEVSVPPGLAAIQSQTETSVDTAGLSEMSHLEEPSFCYADRGTLSLVRHLSDDQTSLLPCCVSERDRQLLSRDACTGK